MPKFEAGEIAIYRGVLDLTENTALDMLQRNGEEVLIISGLDVYHINDSPEYHIQFSDKRRAYVYPSELRKKKPPEENIDWVEKLGLDKLKIKEMV